ncbi:MAG TPA: CPBP family glutamic-type intramembrane protease [Candidatus Limnocylindrales bacterium]|nr:CPBP family glutamic-type intramembrane protease [Candidatus Limnocylindrales bacterium]
MRLDRALRADLRVVLRSRPVLLFIGIELVAGAVFVVRRGSGTTPSVLLIWLALALLAFFAWWAGRHRAAVPTRDPFPDSMARSALALVAAAGMVIWGFGISVTAGLLLMVVGMGGWLWSAVRHGGWRGAAARLSRDPRPFLPLLLLIAVPRIVTGGPAFIVGACLALPSGIGQQLLYLAGLFAPLEAVRGRTDVAAVLAALLFGLIHVPFVLDANHGDLLAATANAMLFQAGVGVVACLAFVRHRAVVPIGVAHALAIG